MRIRRAILIPTILALGLAGSVLTGSGMAVAAGQTPTVHMHVTVPSFTWAYYHG
jgi:hypothetical protein